MKVIDIHTFIAKCEERVVFDVRSPSEFKHAHIPGALSLPLFTDEERALVGTTYKQQSKEKAIKVGLDYFGPKMKPMVEQVEQILHTEDHPAGKEVMVHCWRGGMRSGGVAWLVGFYGFSVFTLEGGYKAFRNWVLDTLAKPYTINILGGYTGSGKTVLLESLRNRGEVIIDLENIAKHKGSAFGNIGMPEQPSQEMFENELAIQLWKKSLHGHAIWIEDESQRIGHVNIPLAFWSTMRKSKVYFLEMDFDKRLHYIVKEYGNLDRERMVNAILRIQKRLGGLETKNAVNALIEGKTEDSFRILLKYYDKYYLKGLQSKENLDKNLITVQCEALSFDEITQLLLK